MQVAMVSNIIYIKSKNPPPRRAVDEFSTEAHSHKSRALEGLKKLKSCFLVHCLIVRFRASPTRVAKMPITQGCQPRRVF